MISNDKHPNAEKWNEILVEEHLRFISMDASAGDSLFLGRALAKRGLYKHIWSYWKKKFSANDSIIETMLNIESLFEAKVLEGALKKELSPTMAMLTLRYNYNWSDKPRRVISDSPLYKGFGG